MLKNFKVLVFIQMWDKPFSLLYENFSSMRVVDVYTPKLLSFILRNVLLDITSIRFFAGIFSLKFLVFLPGVVRDEMGAIVDELVINTKKLIRATSREIDKWRR